jgi:hypothetical protein
MAAAPHIGGTIACRRPARWDEGRSDDHLLCRRLIVADEER